MTRKKQILSIETSKNVMTLFATSSIGSPLSKFSNCLALTPLIFRSVQNKPSSGLSIRCSAYSRSYSTYRPSTLPATSLSVEPLHIAKAYGQTGVPFVPPVVPGLKFGSMLGYNEQRYFISANFQRNRKNQNSQTTYLACSYDTLRGQYTRIRRIATPEVTVLPFFNRSFDKKRLKLLFSWYYANKGENAAFSLVETLQKLGFTHAMKAGISLGVDDLKVPPTKNKAISEAIDLLSTTKASAYSGDVMAVEEFQQFVDTWHRTSENLKTSVVQNFTKGFNSVQNLKLVSVGGSVQRKNTNGATLSPVRDEPGQNIPSDNANFKKEREVKFNNRFTKTLTTAILKNTQQMPQGQQLRSYGNTLNPVYMMAFSGARGNLSQVRQLVGMRGLMADPQGQLVEFPIQSNFREGLTVTEYMISCYGARKGLVDTALRTAAAGYLTRRLVDVAHHQIVRFVTCGTKGGVWLSAQINKKIKQSQDVVLPSTWKVPIHLRQPNNQHPRQITKKKNFLILPGQNQTTLRPGLTHSLTTFDQVVQSKSGEAKLFPLNRRQSAVTKQKNSAPSSFSNEKLNHSVLTRCVGRVLARDLPGIAFRNQEIDVSLGSSPFLRELYETVGIYVRSPLTCRAETGLCQLCYGWSVSANRLVGLGEAVGIIAAQSIGEPGTQLTMRTFHTGGVFSGDIMEECRAKHGGIVSFQGPYMGLMVRTAGGAIAFCLKTPGILHIKGKNEFTTYTLAPNSLLFVRQGERIATGNLLAQIPNLPDIEENTGESTKTMVSNFSGEIRQIPTINKSLENIRILAGQKILPRYVFSGQTLSSSLQGPTYKNSNFVDQDHNIQNLVVPPVQMSVNILPGSHRLGSNLSFGRTGIPTVGRLSFLRKDSVSTLDRTLHSKTTYFQPTLGFAFNDPSGLYPVLHSDRKDVNSVGGPFYSSLNKVAPHSRRKDDMNFKDDSVSSSTDVANRVLYNQIKRLLKKRNFKKRSFCYKTLIQALPYLNFESTSDFNVNHNAITFLPNPLLSSGIDSQHTYFQELLVKNQHSYPMGLFRNRNVVKMSVPKTHNTSINSGLSGTHPITNAISVPKKVSKLAHNSFSLKFDKKWGLQYAILLRSVGPFSSEPLKEWIGSRFAYIKEPDLKKVKCEILPIKLKNYAHLFWTKQLIIFFNCYKEGSINRTSRVKINGNTFNVGSDLKFKNSQKKIYIHSIQKAYLNFRLQNTINRRHKFVNLLSSTALSNRFARKPCTFEGDKYRGKTYTAKLLSTGSIGLDYKGQVKMTYSNCKYLEKNIKCFSCSLPQKNKGTKHKKLCSVENTTLLTNPSSFINTTDFLDSGEIFPFQGTTTFKNFKKAYSSPFPYNYKKSGLLTHFDRVAYKLRGEKEITKLDSKTKTFSIDLKIGTLVNTGDELFNDYASAFCGQIIEKSSSGLTLRLTQNILYSNFKFRPASISPNVQNGHWLHKGTPVVTLPYISNVTGDIVAGIPKIEQLFEARGQALEEVVDQIWQSYKSVVVPQAKAVRECFKEIGLFVVGAIQKVYSSQGVHIADKHLEVIIRQISKRALIVDSGDTEFLADEFVDLNTIECVNWTTYGEIATYRPFLIGITKASLTSNSFLSSASFQQTARVLERETFLEKTDRLLGLKERVMMGALIDAGTGGGGTSPSTTNVFLSQVTKKPTLQNIYQKLNFFSRRVIEHKTSYPNDYIGRNIYKI